MLSSRVSRRLQSDSDVMEKHEDDEKNSYHAQVETSEFENLIIDNGLAIAMINMVYVCLFFYMGEKHHLIFITSFFFLPLHVVNNVFHYKKSLKKRIFRQYFFVGVAVIVTIQSLFYMLYLGLDSGFLMIILAALVYAVNAVAYVDESLLLVAGAMGLFVGGTASMYAFLNNPHIDDNDYASKSRATMEKEHFSSQMNIIFTAFNYVISFGVLMYAGHSHMEVYQSKHRLEVALRIKNP